MFIQVVQGHPTDPDECRRLMDRWQTDLEPGAIGWLGGTYGITDAGEFVAVVRFESEEAAQRNADRPEQTAWWDEMSRCLPDATFHNCSDVTMWLAGGSDDAGFVQIIQGHVKDRDRAIALLEQDSELIQRARPDIIGATLAIDKDGYFTETIAFTTEAAARAGESQEMPDDVRETYEAEMATLEDVTYLDLHQPQFATHY